MVDAPRRLPPTPAERQRTLGTNMTPGAALGLTRFAKPVTQGGSASKSVSIVSGAQTDPVVIGSGASAAGSGDVAIGLDATAANDSTAIGDSAVATGFGSFAANGAATGDGAVGINGGATAAETTAIGSAAIASATQATALGSGSSATGAASVAIGVCNAVGARSVAIGTDALAPNDDDLILGHSTHNVGVPGTFALTSGGATPVGPQPTPASFADVVTLLQKFGLSL